MAEKFLGMRVTTYGWREPDGTIVVGLRTARLGSLGSLDMTPRQARAVINKIERLLKTKYDRETPESDTVVLRPAQAKGEKGENNG